MKCEIEYDPEVVATFAVRRKLYWAAFFVLGGVGIVTIVFAPPIGIAALILLMLVAVSTLRCPACNKFLRLPQARYCLHCGIQLRQDGAPGDKQDNKSLESDE